ncbi:hypothetical protein [Streptomyces sp. NPDC020747]|uniref:hypothetical protein n=1 Tax=Streptomyces sp. NPDC020747 TaxID=3365086 RepID=UPI0037BD2D23
MTVIEFFDAVDAMLDAAIKWIMLGSAIASLLLLAAVAVVTWAAKRVRRGARRACGASGGPNEGLDDREAPEAAEGRTETPGYREAA